MALSTHSGFSKYILSKTQKQRYHIKVQRLQELVMQMEQQHGFVNNSTQDSKDDIARQTVKWRIIGFEQQQVTDKLLLEQTGHYKPTSSSNR